MRNFFSALAVVLLGCALLAIAPLAARAAKPGATALPTVEVSPTPEVFQDVRLSDWGTPPLSYAMAHYGDLHILQTEIENLRREVAALRQSKAATPAAPSPAKAGQ